jgi:hypothetical protein
MRGRHGRGGSGGPGGDGGSPFYYNELIQQQRYDYSRECYVTETYTITQTVDGGNRGRRGKKGATPAPEPIGGAKGSNGSFQIQVVDGNSSRSYDSRFDLQFVEIKTNHVSKMMKSKTFEFGETVFVTKCKVRNTGGMEMPRQRVMIGVEACKEVSVSQCSARLFLAKNSTLFPGHVMFADEGFLQFDCPFPSNMANRSDFDPVQKVGWIRYSAHQLGPENATDDISKKSDFIEKYQKFHAVPKGDAFFLSFPIENRTGIRGVRSLAPGETTWLKLTLENLTIRDLGDLSSPKRSVCVQFYFGDDQPYDISIRGIEVRGQNGSVIPICPSTSPKGYRENVPFIGARGDITLHLSLKLKGVLIPTAARAALQADIYVQKIDQLLPNGSTIFQSKKRLIQRRIFTLSCQPKFDHDCDADVVIICTTASTQTQVAAWEMMSTKLGLSSKIYSLARYGHLDSGLETENIQLREAFKNKLIVILNEEYHANPNRTESRNSTIRPSQLLSSHYDYDGSTRFMVVGGQRSSVGQLSPTSTASLSVSKSVDSENRKCFRSSLRTALSAERSNGCPLVRSERIGMTVSVKIRTFCRRPSRETMDKIMARRATNMTEWLHKTDHLRPYTVEWNLNESGIPEELHGKSKLLTRVWKIGEIAVRPGAPRYENDVVLVESVRNSNPGSSPFMSLASIDSKSMMHATLKALSLKKLTQVFLRSIHLLARENKAHKEDQTSRTAALGESFGTVADHDEDKPFYSEKNLEVCMVAVDVLIGHFVLDVSNYYHGRFNVENAIERSTVIRELLLSSEINSAVDESLTNDSLKSALKPWFSLLVAGLLCAAKTKDLLPWWNPFSRKQKASRAMVESVELLTTSWQAALDDYVIWGEKKKLDQSVKRYISVDRKKWFVRTRGRWRAGMNHVLSPNNTDRYPRSPGFDPQTTRVRRTFEFDVDDTFKIKKPPKGQSLDPQQARRERQNQQTHAKSRTTVRQNVESDDRDFRHSN